MNKVGLVIVVLIIVVIGFFTLGGKKDSNTVTAPEPTASQVMEDKKAEGTAVTVTSTGYEPKDITVKKGTKVVWTNKSGAAVTVDSAQHPTHLVYPPLNLGQFEDGASVSLVFNEAGKYFYHNHLNATQFGSVTVE